jgi:hypothetical protein
MSQERAMRDRPEQRDDDVEDERFETWPSSADASDVEDPPTIAPEERGATPSTEHAPGADL